MKAFMSDPRDHVQSWKMLGSARESNRVAAVDEAQRILEETEPCTHAGQLCWHVDAYRPEHRTSRDHGALAEALAVFVEGWEMAPKEKAYLTRQITKYSARTVATIKAGMAENARQYAMTAAHFGHRRMAADAAAQRS
jgi:hypothetical protein